MKTNQLTDLTSQIELLIHNHMAEYRKAAQDAVARAFDAATTLSAPIPKAPTGPGATVGRSPRRTQAQIEELSGRLYQEVVANPGETMGFLAGKLGVRARDLQRPADLLRQTRRVRTAGQRHLTRYFPLCGDEPVAA